MRGGSEEFYIYNYGSYLIHIITVSPRKPVLRPYKQLSTMGRFDETSKAYQTFTFEPGTGNVMTFQCLPLLFKYVSSIKKLNVPDKLVNSADC